MKDMNKKRLAFIIAAALAPAVTQAYNYGTLTFTGNVERAAAAVACSMTVNEQSATEVQLANAALESFGHTGATAGNTDFTLQFANCPRSGSTATLTLFGAADETDSKAFMNTASGDAAAQGVGILIEDIKEGVVVLAPAGVGREHRIIDGIFNVPLRASMIRTGEAVKEGLVTASATVNMEYQ